MSLMDFSTLVRAVLVYMKDHYPTTPDEYNFQAELKAACHWYWHPSGRKDRCQEEGDCSSIKLPKLRSGPHRDIRVKIAALVTSRKWISVLEEIKMESSLPKSSQRVEKNGESSPDEDGNEERIYGVYLLNVCWCNCVPRILIRVLSMTSITQTEKLGAANP